MHGPGPRPPAQALPGTSHYAVSAVSAAGAREGLMTERRPPDAAAAPLHKEPVIPSTAYLDDICDLASSQETSAQAIGHGIRLKAAALDV